MLLSQRSSEKPWIFLGKGSHAPGRSWWLRKRVLLFWLQERITTDEGFGCTLTQVSRLRRELHSRPITPGLHANQGQHSADHPRLHCQHKFAAPQPTWCCTINLRYNNWWANGPPCSTVQSLIEGKICSSNFTRRQWKELVSVGEICKKTKLVPPLFFKELESSKRQNG